MDLKAELEKAKEAARVAANASKKKLYDLRVQETEARLTKELAEVCRDYYQEVWTEALNLAGVPTALEWRRAENVYYPPELQEAFAAFLGFGADAAPATTTPKQLPSTQAPPHPPETSKGLARLVTKARGWKWPRARKLKLYQRLRAQRLTEARKLLPRQRGPSLSSLTLWPRRRRSAWARLLILLSPAS